MNQSYSQLCLKANSAHSSFLRSVEQITGTIGHCLVKKPTPVTSPCSSLTERSRLHRSLDPTHNMDKVPNMMIPHRAQTTIGSQRQMDKSNFQGNPNKPVYRYERTNPNWLSISKRGQS